MKQLTSFLEPSNKDMALVVDEKERSQSRSRSRGASSSMSKSGGGKGKKTKSALGKKKKKKEDGDKLPEGRKGSLPLFQMLQPGDVKSRTLVQKLIVRAAKITDDEMEEIQQYIKNNPVI